MKTVYYFDKQTHVYIGSDFIAETAEIPKYATEIDPFDTDKEIYDPIVWNGTDWTYGTQEEFEDQQDKQSFIDPTSEQVALTVLAQNYSGTGEEVATLEKSLTALSQEYSKTLEHVKSLEQALTDLAQEKLEGDK